VIRRLRVLIGLLLAWRVLGPIITPRFRSPQEHPWRIPGRTVFVGDSEFLVREFGNPDGTPVVLIHGLGGSSLAEWYRVAPLLAEGHRVITLDHRSHGLSPKTVARFEVEDIADDIAGIMAAVGVGRGAVVGYSMGGAIAQALAYRHPGVVDRLILVATFAHHPPFHRLTRAIAAWVIRSWERITGIGNAEARAAYLLGVGAVDRRHARWLWEETHRRDPEAGAAATFALLRFDSTPWIGQVAIPALVVIPTADQLADPRWQYDLASRLPDVRVLELVGALHEAPWTHAEEIAAGIEDFLRA
jgi:3-oxoadipate enol-lactonase